NLMFKKKTTTVKESYHTKEEKPKMKKWLFIIMPIILLVVCAVALIAFDFQKNRKPIECGKIKSENDALTGMLLSPLT
ncbi:MAG: hypothetical protein WCI63_04325, partial [bacterium]